MIPILIIMLSVAIDQISKYIVSANMELGESFAFVKYILNITYVTNSGAAFGILKNHRWVFMIFSVIAIVAMTAVLVWFVMKKEYFFMQIALSFMISGGIGNMIDRFYHGYVIDFLEFDFVEFAIFNIADSCITVGCTLFIIFIFRNRNAIFVSEKSIDEDTPDIDIYEPDEGT